MTIFARFRTFIILPISSLTDLKAVGHQDHTYPVYQLWNKAFQSFEELSNYNQCATATILEIFCRVQLAHYSKNHIPMSTAFGNPSQKIL